jgi:hypothetical protein
MDTDRSAAVQTSAANISHRRQKLVRQICDWNEQALGLLVKIKEQQWAFIICRWNIGRAIDELLDGGRGRYGDSVIDDLAGRTGLHPNTLYECRRFFVATPDGPETWMENVSEGSNVVLWKHVRTLISRGSDIETLGPEGALERRLYNLDRRTESLETELSEVAAQARSNGIGRELKERVLGVADRVADVKFGPSMAISKLSTPRDDAHLAYVRELACAFCGAAPPSEPHHVEKVATAMQGNDYSCVPVCRRCHDAIHALGNQSFQRERDTTFAEAVAQTLAFRLCGQFIKFPKRTALE